MTTEVYISILSLLISVAVAVPSSRSTQKIQEKSNKNSKDIELMRIDHEKWKESHQERKTIQKYQEPYARSCYDLQSRIYNITNQQLIEHFLNKGSARERSYAILNTSFLICQYFCWTEIIRRDINFIDLGKDAQTQDLLRLQDQISSAWGTDKLPPLFRIFAGEQRALGEALIRNSPQGLQCIGYGAFLELRTQTKNPLIDDLQNDIISLSENLHLSLIRLTKIQNILIDIIHILDPGCLRFPKEKRTKIDITRWV